MPPAPFPKLPAVAGVRLGTTQAIKSRRRDDLAVVEVCEGASVCGVFTQNAFAAAPVQVCRDHLRQGAGIRGLAINSGIANAGTLGRGLQDARHSCRLLARLLGCEARQTLPFSTGVIMERLPMQRYAKGLQSAVANLAASNWAAAARAIMTTDTAPKGAWRKSGGKTIVGIAKGSGMIHPNMGTMLAFVATDAAVPPATLRRWQRAALKNSFNAISVDGDTSTNDSFILIATGKAGAPTRAQSAALQNGINAVCAELAEAIVRDGEGAQKLIKIRVCGGASRAVCLRVARSVALSPLVKTALAAGDANVGRFLMAIGNGGGGFVPSRVSMRIGDAPIIGGGGLHRQYNEAKAAALLAKDEVNINIRLGASAHEARIKTCDLTHRYIEINADYRS